MVRAWVRVPCNTAAAAALALLHWHTGARTYAGCGAVCSTATACHATDWPATFCMATFFFCSWHKLWPPQILESFLCLSCGVGNLRHNLRRAAVNMANYICRTNSPLRSVSIFGYEDVSVATLISEGELIKAESGSAPCAHTRHPPCPVWSTTFPLLSHEPALVLDYSAVQPCLGHTIRTTCHLSEACITSLLKCL
jgi:hypothetical protein